MTHYCNLQQSQSSSNCCNNGKVLNTASLYKVAMSKFPKHFLKQWRQFRGLSQEDLAAEVETTAGVISLLENHERDLSNKWLQRLAPALKTRPGAILDYDPDQIDNDVLEIWATLSERDKTKAKTILKTLAG